MRVMIKRDIISIRFCDASSGSFIIVNILVPRVISVVQIFRKCVGIDIWCLWLFIHDYVYIYIVVRIFFFIINECVSLFSLDILSVIKCMTITSEDFLRCVISKIKKQACSFSLANSVGKHYFYYNTNIH